MSVVVLGANPSAEGLRRKLSCMGLIARYAYAAHDTGPGSWNAWINAATALAVSGSGIADDPAAWAAWTLSKPVVSLGDQPSAVLADSIRDALFPQSASRSSSSPERFWLGKGLVRSASRKD